jgi:hypothetical protein
LSCTKHFINKLEPEFDQVGIVGYGTDAPAEARVELRCLNYYSADQCFQGTNPISYTAALDVLERVPANGSTNLAEGMLRGLEMLGINANTLEESIWNEANDCDADTDHCSQDGSNKKVMILIADLGPNKNPWDDSGVATENCYATDLYQPNVGNSSEDRAKDCAYFYAEKAARNKVTIYSIGLVGNGADTDLLQTLADVTASLGGQFYAAPSTAQLDDIFDAILQEAR